MQKNNFISRNVKMLDELTGLRGNLWKKLEKRDVYLPVSRTFVIFPPSIAIAKWAQFH